jgi:hypothetical protein
MPSFKVQLFLSIVLAFASVNTANGKYPFHRRLRRVPLLCPSFHHHHTCVKEALVQRAEGTLAYCFDSDRC